jgi:hypothetical protein
MNTSRDGARVSWPEFAAPSNRLALERVERSNNNQPECATSRPSASSDSGCVSRRQTVEIGHQRARSWPSFYWAPAKLNEQQVDDSGQRRWQHFGNLNYPDNNEEQQKEKPEIPKEKPPDSTHAPIGGERQTQRRRRAAAGGSLAAAAPLRWRLVGSLPPFTPDVCAAGG